VRRRDLVLVDAEVVRQRHARERHRERRGSPEHAELLQELAPAE
jgi:hypothetical protein